MKASSSLRDNRFSGQHDPIYNSLDLVPNWLVYGHLSLASHLQRLEKERLHKWHLLIRDTAKRFFGRRDLDALGWFLREEGNGQHKRFHFHFSLTSDNLESTSPEVVCRYLSKQWAKIGKSVCQIDPWNPTKTPLGIWYLTQMETYPVSYSRYFHGDNCRWKMSTLLYSRIVEIANPKENYEKEN
jgi:hypothetical protein